MDPLTQGVIGAVASQQAAKKQHILAATALGFLSGMTPDLDILIRSDADPLLALEYHRQFTHSLFFIPIGSFICALLAYFLVFRREYFLNQGFTFKRVWLYCALAYTSHGLLDACTTYGTQLLWPFSDMRVAWNTISIIDPLFTLPLLTLIIWAALKRSKTIAHSALAWVVIYSTFGIVQRERAEAVGLDLAASRGHEPIALEAKPSFANLFVWKVVYTTEDKFYVDAVKVGLSHRVYEGDAIPKLNIANSFPWLDPDSQQMKDIERFRWFSNGYVAISPKDPSRIIDIRYSMIPNEIRGLWGIALSEDAEDGQHVNYVFDRSRNRATFNQLWQMIVQ
jgi:inner membrane protein